jgi:hypothetical protein
LTLILIDNYVSNERYRVIFSGEQNDLIIRTWNMPDEVLIRLQDTKFFQGKTTWSDLTPSNFQFLIIENMNKLDDLAVSDRINLENDVVRSLYFLIGAMIYSIELVTESQIDMFNIQRISTEKANFSYYSTFLYDLELTPRKPGLRLV